MDKEKPKQYVAPRNNRNDAAFSDDALDRKVQAEQLTKYLDHLQEGAVLAIDAPWGEGKSYFGENWAKQLKVDSHKVIYIDAFKQDYIDDPFLLITAEIDSVFPEFNLKGPAIGAIKVLQPSLRNAVNFLGAIFLGNTDLSDNFKNVLEETIRDTTDKASQLLEDKLNNYKNEKEILNKFLKKLEAIAKDQEKPIVIIIDELDRCRPDFAVHLIECIKHLFNVPNLIFVLLINKKQLENAIRGIYGYETDAEIYLGKFINLFFSFSNNNALTSDLNKHPKLKFIDTMLQRHGISEYLGMPELTIKIFLLWALTEKMSLRDIERSCAYLIMSDSKKTLLITYLIALKIKRPGTYEKLKANDLAEHRQEANRLLDQVNTHSLDREQWSAKMLLLIRELHLFHIGQDNILQKTLFIKQALVYFEINNINTDEIKTIFTKAFNKIDLAIDIS